ncbi:MAG: restriction endonuclease [Polyangiaceae bacterium]
MTSDGVWMVRAGRGGALAAEFVEKGYVSIGFGDGPVEPVAPGTSREDVLAKVRAAHPNRKRGKQINEASQLYRFLSEMEASQGVITYDPSSRLYILGSLVGPPTREDNPSDGHPYRRKTEWTHRVPRDSLRVSTRNTLGSTLTIFLLNDEATEDIRKNAVSLDTPQTIPPPVAVDDEEEEEAGLAVLFDDVVTKSREFIEDQIAHLDPDDLERLVAGILRAMGYVARVTKKGPDRGVDVFASPDGLGLQEPRIFVEVKRRSAAISAPDLRSFLGGRKPGDRCLYVSTGGFTKEAHYEAERATVPLTLIDLPMLRELLVEHYEGLDAETRTLVPLTKVYWPAPGD